MRHWSGNIYGMEKNITTYNLCRMNMLLHGVKDAEFGIHHGDTLTNDWEMLRETNPAKKPTFDAVVASPPFRYRWDSGDAMGEDVRFKSHGVAPKSAADFAFLLHGFHYLKDEGVMAFDVAQRLQELRKKEGPLGLRDRCPRDHVLRVTPRACTAPSPTTAQMRRADDHITLHYDFE